VEVFHVAVGSERGRQMMRRALGGGEGEALADVLGADSGLWFLRGFGL
jgi:hypothetical protein